MKTVGNALRVFHSKGRYNRSSVGTFVERTSRYVILVQLDNAKPETVRDGFVRELKGVPQNLLKSITYDQGREMAAHQDLAATLNLAVYFCDRHAPWQRGSNENTNGLLRQYLPKGSDLNAFSQADLNAIAAKLNTRPRKNSALKRPKKHTSPHTHAQTLKVILHFRFDSGIYFSSLSQPPPHPPPQGRARAELSRESVSHFMRLSARTA